MAPRAIAFCRVARVRLGLRSSRSASSSTVRGLASNLATRDVSGSSAASGVLLLSVSPSGRCDHFQTVDCEMPSFLPNACWVGLWLFGLANSFSRYSCCDRVRQESVLPAIVNVTSWYGRCHKTDEREFTCLALVPGRT